MLQTYIFKSTVAYLARNIHFLILKFISPISFAVPLVLPYECREANLKLGHNIALLPSLLRKSTYLTSRKSSKLSCFAGLGPASLFFFNLRNGPLVLCFLFCKLNSFYFTFMWPCIVTNFFVIKPIDALISQIYFVMKLYTFRTVCLFIMRGLFTVHSAMVYSYVIQVCRQLSSRMKRSSILVLLESCHITFCNVLGAYYYSSRIKSLIWPKFSRHLFFHTQ